MKENILMKHIQYSKHYFTIYLLKLDALYLWLSYLIPSLKCKINPEKNKDMLSIKQRQKTDTNKRQIGRQTYRELKYSGVMTKGKKSPWIREDGICPKS